MTLELITSANAPRQAVGANDDGISSVRPQGLQNMELVVHVGNGRTVEIPLQGHMATEAVHSSGSSPSQVTAAGEESTVVAESHDAEANKYLNDMRGWIMTVATLFVSMSFQAMSQRPSWMPEPKDGWKIFLGTFPTKEAGKVVGYVVLNTFTFSASLVLVLMLLLPNMSSPEVILRQVRTMMMFLATTVAFNFSVMISKDSSVTCFVLTVMVIYAFLTASSFSAFTRLRSRLHSASRV